MTKTVTGGAVKYQIWDWLLQPITIWDRQLQPRTAHPTAYLAHHTRVGWRER